MVAIPFSQRIAVPLAPLGGALAGLVVAAIVVLTPGSVLESLVAMSGIPAVLPAAEPPLGSTARTALAFVLGTGTGVAVWFALFLALGTRALGGAQRSVAIPDASRRTRKNEEGTRSMRAPVLATRDLGTPFLEVRAKSAASPVEPEFETAEERPVTATIAAPIAPRPSMPRRAEPAPIERDLPRDLDAPLAAYDPAAIPDVPAEPVRAVPPLVASPPPLRAVDPVRDEIVDATPAARPAARHEPIEAAAPIATPATDVTIHALLERLERGVARREAEAAAAAAANKSHHSLQDTLAELRTLAAR